MSKRLRYFLWLAMALYSQVVWSHSDGYAEFEFVKNEGQWHPNVNYRVELPEAIIYLEQGRLKFQLSDLSALTALHTRDYKGKRADARFKHHVYTATFVGANPNCKIEQEDLLESYHNYYLGKDKSKWASGVPISLKVRYKALYPGVDLLIFSHKGSIKYEFHCNNYAASKQIQLQFDGQEDLKIKDGALTVHTSLGEVSENPPIVYHASMAVNDTIKSRYKLSKNMLTYQLEVSKQNEHLPLVIDPDLIFSTYSGSRSTNFGFTATYDSEGFLYSGSLIFGTGYPTTVGAFDRSFNGGSGVFGLPGCDVAISKYDTNGRKAIFSTYLGGSGDDVPHSIVVNSRDELYIYGTTGSRNFPTTDSVYQDTLTSPNTNNGRTLEIAVGYTFGSDIFVSAFQSDGKKLLASTYIGGSENDGLNNPGPFGFGNPRTLNYNYADVARGEIDIDSDDNIYVVSSTRSTDFPMHGNPVYNSYRGGNQDGIIIKFKPLLDSVIWSSYYGGAFSDAIYSLAFSKNGNLTIAGGTTSSILFPSGTLSGYATFQGGRADGFVAELNKNGQSVLASTYFGTTEYDQIYFVERDRYNNVYVFGQTEDRSSKLVQNALYNTPTAGQFITKFTPKLDSIVWSTKFGTPAPTATSNATPNISPTAFLVDLCNSVYLSGWGGTTNSGLGNGSVGVRGMDTTSDAFQKTTDGSDLYLMVLADDASRLIYGSFYGGPSANEHVDGGTSRFDRKGKIYQAACAGCPRSFGQQTSDFPTKPKPGAVSNTNNAQGGCNNAVFKMDFLLPAVVAEFQLPRTICTRDSVAVRNLSLEQKATQYKWYFGNGDSSTLKNPKVFYDSAGTYEILLVVYDSASCNLDDSISKKVTIVNPDPTLTLPNDSICLGETTVLGITNSTDDKFTWLPGATLDDSTKMNPKASPTASTQYTLLIDNGVCVDTNYLFVQVDSFIRADFTIPDSICSPDTINLVNRSVILHETVVKWEYPNATTDSVLSPDYLITKEGLFSFWLVLTDSNSCNEADSVLKTVEAKNDTTFSLNPVLVCNNNFMNIGLETDTNYIYHWNSSFGITDSTISNPQARTTIDTSFYLFIDKGVCTDTAIQPLQADSIRIQTSNDTVICSNVPTITLSGQHFGTGTLYHWSSNDKFDDQLNTNSLDSNANIFYESLYENIYYMQSVSSRGCRTYDSTIVFINDFGIRVSDSVDLCLNDTTFLTVISETENDTLDVIWSPFEDIYGPNDSTTIKVNPSESRTYTVNVQTAFNCRAAREVHVFVSDLDTSEAVLIGSRDTIVTELFSQLDVTPKGYAYEWSPAEGLSSPFADNPVARPAVTTNYIVTISDPEVPNCTVERNFKVLVEELFCEPPYVFLPNTFTPNGDGNNDELQVYGKYIEEMNLQIFNRWGELVFESNDQSESWDGSYKGDENWPEVFVYQLYVKCIDGQEFKSKGDITLVK